MGSFCMHCLSGWLGGRHCLVVHISMRIHGVDHFGGIEIMTLFHDLRLLCFSVLGRAIDLRTEMLRDIYCITIFGTGKCYKRRGR